jgi:hypothetical protein
MAARPGAILERELHEALGDVEHDIEGTLFYRDGRGGLSMRDIRARWTEPRLAANTWHILDLDEREAAQLAADIRKLLEHARLKTRHRRQKKIRCPVRDSPQGQ